MTETLARRPGTRAQRRSVSLYEPTQDGRIFPQEPSFSSPAEERRHVKQGLVAACRAFTPLNQAATFGPASSSSEAVADLAEGASARPASMPAWRRLQSPANTGIDQQSVASAVQCRPVMYPRISGVDPGVARFLPRKGADGPSNPPPERARSRQGKAARSLCRWRRALPAGLRRGREKLDLPLHARAD